MLGTELRAAPSDRLKTDEELVVAESRRLEGLEAERKERMLMDGGKPLRYRGDHSPGRPQSETS